jgi:glycosyl hydrolase family 123
MTDGRNARGLLVCMVVACWSVALSGEGGHGQVVVVDPLEPIYDAQSVVPMGNTLRLTGPRNGTCSAAVVVLGGEDPTATVTMLRGPDGEIPASSLRLRYAAREQGYELRHEPHLRDGETANYLEAYHDVLLNAPLPSDPDGTSGSGSDATPVWLTVRIPPDAAPGEYRGQMRIAGRVVPIVLAVSAWNCPDPNDWTAHAGIVTCPEALAAHYRIEPWSQEHWELVEQELKLLGGLGADELWIRPLASNAIRGASHLVEFRTRGETIEPDLTNLSRYLKRYEQNVGIPEHVMLNVWDEPFRPPRRGPRTPTARVILDGKEAKIPAVTESDGEPIWRRFVQEAMAQIKERGWERTTAVFALAGDQRPSEDEVKAFAQIAPDVGWAVWTHGRGEKPPNQLESGEKYVFQNGMHVAYYAHPYTPGISDWARPKTGKVIRTHIARGLQGGWEEGFATYASCRNYLHKYAPPTQYRGYANGTNISLPVAHKIGAGFAFLWFDFWSPPGGKPNALLNRWSSTLTRSGSPSLVEPGPSGPVATVRYEMLREGLQETEARIQIERAIVSGRLPKALVDRAIDVLDEGVQARYRNGKFQAGHAGNSLGAPSRLWGAPADYRAYEAKLFDLAADVAKVVR